MSSSAGGFLWTMSADDRLTFVSSIVFLALAGLAAARARHDPLAIPLGALYLDLFAYDVLDLIGNATGDGPPHWLNAAAAGLAVPLAFNIVVTFVGQRRREAWRLRGLTAYFVALGLACLTPFFFPAMAWFPLSVPWAAAIALGLSPTLAYLVLLLVRHLRASHADERARAWLVLAAVVLGVGGSGTDIFAMAGAPLPRLAAFGLLSSGAVLAAGTLRLQLVRGMTPRTLLASLLIAIAGIAAQLGLVRFMGANMAMMLLGSLVVTVAVWGGLRLVTGNHAEQAARLRYHVTLGRLASQMAHDVLNPVAAVRGSAQFLLEERARGRSIDGQLRYLTIIVEQSDRIRRVIEQYRRLGRAESVPTALDLGALLEEIAEAQRAALGDQITIELALEPDCPAVLADQELVAAAVENLLRNASEAMPEGGKITVRTVRSDARVRLSVTDDGVGMDAVTRERAQDDFYTTKATGSGLGLAFVRRVAEAHASALHLTSSLGHGTTVGFDLPLATPEE